MPIAEVKTAIRQFILETFLSGEPSEYLRDDTPLLTSSIVDSLGALGLATFIEKEFHVELTFEDTSTERFNCIDDIAAMIVKKQAPETAAVR